MDLILDGDIWNKEVELKEGEGKVLASEVEFVMCAYSYSLATGVQYIQSSSLPIEEIKTITYKEASTK